MLKGETIFNQTVNSNQQLLDSHSNVWYLLDCVHTDYDTDYLPSVIKALDQFKDISATFNKEYASINFKYLIAEEIQKQFNHKWNFKFYLMLLFFVPYDVPTKFKKFYLLMILNKCFDITSCKTNNKFYQYWNNRYDTFEKNINFNDITNEEVESLLLSMTENLKPYYYGSNINVKNFQNVINELIQANFQNDFFDILKNLLWEYKNDDEVMRFLAKVGEYAINSIVYIKFLCYEYLMYDILDYMATEEDYIETTLIDDVFFPEWYID